MSKHPVRALAAVPAAAALALALTAAPASAAPAAPAAGLRCHASMTNSRPADYTSTGVRVRTVAYARATTIAHYRTTNHKKSRKTGSQGRKTIWYYISSATPGFRVVVDVYVSRGSRKGKCSTSFVPHR
jgi:hypothetical protein